MSTTDLGPDPYPDPVDAVPEVDENVWELDHDLSESFGALATEKHTDIGENVWVLPLFVMKDRKKRILVDKSTDSPHLVIRKEQRDVVDWAFKESRDKLQRSRVVVAVRGSLGIGKSWSALWYMRKLVTQPPDKQRPFIFERGPRTSRMMYLIMPPKAEGSKLNVYHLKQNCEIPEEWKNCRIIDLVIDPAHYGTEETPTPSALMDASGHIFVPVSPDDRHLISDKDMGEYVQLVVGPWGLSELKVAFPYMLYNNPLRNADAEVLKAQMDTMESLYYIVGGLPRYLTMRRGHKRKGEISPEKAKKHSKELWKALKSGKYFHENIPERILTRFFTLRAGVDESGGYNPNREFATLDFVSPGAVMAAGQTVLHNINTDTVWKNSEDSSAIGLAYERVVLVLLAQGTEGMNKLGVDVRCRHLVASGGQKGGGSEVAKGQQQPRDDRAVQFALSGSRKGEEIEKEANDAAFEKVVRDSGRGMACTISQQGSSKLESGKTVLVPPDGYSNFDAMIGADLGLNATLQQNHSISGLEYIRQREAYGLNHGNKFALVFVVPPHRFDSGWRYTQTFSWKGEEESNKRKHASDIAVPPRSPIANKKLKTDAKTQGASTYTMDAKKHADAANNPQRHTSKKRLKRRCRAPPQ